MDTPLQKFILEIQEILDEEFSKLYSVMDAPSLLKKSMLYSLEAGGKRIRPMLLIATYKAYKSDIQKVLSSATALEMIHTYSLIHDDLPAMDNDDYRRGKLTNHKAFDEATAILAGDALLTHSFYLIANDTLLSDSEKVHMIRLLSLYSGPNGMVAGQVLDMEAENDPISIEQLEQIHVLKTGELIKFAVKAGAILGNATKEQIQHLETFSYYLGLLFQIQDDILDVIGNTEKLGKAVGSDEDQNKSTYPKLLGLENAKKQRDAYAGKAKASLQKAGADTIILMELVDYFSQRDH
ncbi:polyprenyl synthetase family protein [Cerasibacillus terrae]|uniref:Farnesyl diphosphate synthase n=1 Tax=Cerasibacillus terrae TaxID=2498845 RepID=A0A5C8P3P9_9BACI|nr:farnesyl diphosphate synthase [Cerasibacillus terrae]TXL67934.1 polyprenyl synthetase family protein [Cerasibacillus terrae]